MQSFSMQALVRLDTAPFLAMGARLNLSHAHYYRRFLVTEKETIYWLATLTAKLCISFLTPICADTAYSRYARISGVARNITGGEGYWHYLQKNMKTNLAYFSHLTTFVFIFLQNDKVRTEGHGAMPPPQILYTDESARSFEKNKLLIQTTYLRESILCIAFIRSDFSISCPSIQRSWGNVAITYSWYPGDQQKK